MEHSNCLVILDAGHGSNTLGKCSPDKLYKEYLYCREIKKLLLDALKKEGYNTYDCCPEETDTSITQRVYRCNKEMLTKFNAQTTILISIHTNASAKPDWDTANGFEALISLNASTRSKKLATLIVKSAKDAGKKVRPTSKEISYKYLNLGICRMSNMPATLVELFFHNNKEEVMHAITNEGKLEYVTILLNAINMYFS